jgi:predicted GNAT family N-acyltransferase
MSELDFRFANYCSEDYYEIVSLRQKILRTPIGKYLTPSDLTEESDNLFLGCYENNKLLACCLLKQVNKNEIKIRQVAVLPQMQGKNIGKRLMEFVESYSINQGFQKISLNARFNVVDFYTKLAYSIIGEPFQEIDMLHYKMEKVLQELPI